MTGQPFSVDATIVVGSFSGTYGLSAHAGEVLAVLGPNGAGKSTLLRALAGLVPLARGRVRLGGAVVEQAPDGVRLRPQARGVGYVFQDSSLFQHLSALDNVAFGPRARGARAAQARAGAQVWLERLGVGELARSRPAHLSGGEAQRVALARALAVEPSTLLLDEPLSALDVETRADVRAELRRALADFRGTTVLVTHDPLDAASLADRIAVVERGLVTQQGTATELAAAPASGYVANLVDRTGLAAVLSEIRRSGTATADAAGLGPIVGCLAGAHASAVGDTAFASIRRADVELHPEGTHRSGPNEWSATVTGLERDLRDLVVALTLGARAGAPSLTATLSHDAATSFPGGIGEGLRLVVRLPPHLVTLATRT